MDIRSSQQHGYRQIDKANIKLLHFVSDGAHVRKHKKRKSVVKKGQKHIKLSPGLYIYNSHQSQFLVFYGSAQFHSSYKMAGKCYQVCLLGWRHQLIKPLYPTYILCYKAKLQFHPSSKIEIMGCPHTLRDINFPVRLFFGLGVGMATISGFFSDNVKSHCWQSLTIKSFKTRLAYPLPGHLLGPLAKVKKDSFEESSSSHLSG